jgi:CubicO group peptidase (beta-lactamase class C family)
MKSTFNQYLQNYLDEGCKRLLLPKCNIAIVDGSSEHLISKQNSKKKDTIFKIGSLTKLITALAILKLNEDGLVELNDPISKHLNWNSRKATAKMSITILDLLMHTSGLPRGEIYHSTPSLNTLKQKFDEFNLQKKIYKYSNFGYIILGKIIERKTNTNFSEYVQQKIFASLEMNKSGFGKISDNQLTTPHSLSYFSQKDKTPFDSIPISLMSAPEASFDMHSTAEDMSKLIKCILNKGEYKKEKVWNSESISALFSNFFPIRKQLNSSIGFLNVNDLFFSDGEHWGHSASILIYPKEKIGIIAMTNRSSAGPELLYLSQSIKRYLSNIDPNKALSYNYHYPDLITGTYISDQGDLFVIDRKGDSNYAKYNKGRTRELIYKGQNCFILKNKELSKYICRLVLVNNICEGLNIGPHYFQKQLKDKSKKITNSYQYIIGIYFNVTIGRVALFERNNNLILAYSPFKEAILKEISPDVFTQQSGPFSYEKIKFNKSTKELLIGDLIFRHSNTQY